MSAERLRLPHPKTGESLPGTYFDRLGRIIDEYGCPGDDVTELNAALNTQTGTIEVRSSDRLMAPHDFDAATRPLLRAGEGHLNLGRVGMIRLVAFRGDVPDGMRMRNSRWHRDVPNRGPAHACSHISASTRPTAEFAAGWLVGRSAEGLLLASKPGQNYLAEHPDFPDQLNADVDAQIEHGSLVRFSPDTRQAVTFDWRHLHRAGLNDTHATFENRTAAVVSVYK